MSTFTTSDGLNLHYEDEGDGLPILCLAGLTRTTRDFDYVTPHLAGHRVIKLDYRGRGKSDWSEDWSTYSLQVECRDVLELMAHLGLSKIAIIGTSRGGLNAMALAMGAPNALMGAVLNDVGPVVDPGGIELILTYLGRNPSATTFEEAAAALQHVMVGFNGMPDGFWIDEAKRQFRQGAEGLEITYDPRLRDATEAMAQEGGTPDLWPLFEALKGKPTALIWGLNSYLLKESTVAEMQARNPEMIVGRVPDRGHVPLLNEPEAVAALNMWLGQLR